MSTFEERKAFFEQFASRVPHNKQLGLTVEELRLDGEEVEATMRLPWQPHLVGNPATGILHGGPITAAMDATCGAAVLLGLREPLRVATLDLRIDYLGAAPPKQDIVCVGRCFKITTQVAFTRGYAHCGDPSKPIATATGTFMIIRGGPSKMLTNLQGDA